MGESESTENKEETNPDESTGEGLAAPRDPKRLQERVRKLLEQRGKMTERIEDLRARVDELVAQVRKEADYRASVVSWRDEAIRKLGAKVAQLKGQSPGHPAATEEASHDSVAPGPQSAPSGELSRGIEYCFLAGVEGNVAEFAPAAGSTAVTLAKSLEACSMDLGYCDTANRIRSRNLLLFHPDGAAPEGQGEDQVDSDSPYVKSGLWREDLERANSGDEIAATCLEYLGEERFKVVSGDFRSALSNSGIGKLSLIHLDCPLHAQTLAVLNACFENGLIANGCLILFAHWNRNRADPAFGQQRAWKEARERFSIDWSDEGGFGNLGRKIVIQAQTPGA